MFEKNRILVSFLTISFFFTMSACTNETPFTKSNDNSLSDTQSPEIPLSIEHYLPNKESERLLNMIPQGDCTFFFNLFINETVNTLQIQCWILDENHEWKKAGSNGVGDISDYSIKNLMIQVLPDYSTYSWFYDGEAATQQFYSGGDYFQMEDWSSSGQISLNSISEIKLDKVIPLVLYMAKIRDESGDPTTSVSNILMSYEHPEQIDADRAVLITITFS